MEVPCINESTAKQRDEGERLATVAASRIPVDRRERTAGMGDSHRVVARGTCFDFEVQDTDDVLTRASG